MYKNDIDEAFETEQAKFEAVSALIKAHPVLNAAISKHLPEDYSGMLSADGFFDMLSPEETEILHKELCSMIKTMAWKREMLLIHDLYFINDLKSS